MDTNSQILVSLAAAAAEGNLPQITAIDIISHKTRPTPDGTGTRTTSQINVTFGFPRIARIARTHTTVGGRGQSTNLWSTAHVPCDSAAHALATALEEYDSATQNAQ